jgi:integrase
MERGKTMTQQAGQKGSYDIQRGWWVIRYYVKVADNADVSGKPKSNTIRRSHQLGRLTDFPPKRHRSKAKNADRAARLGVPNAIIAIANEFLLSINKQQTLETMPRLAAFIESTYLPWAQLQKKPSTYKGYRDIFEDHFKSLTADVWLRDVQPPVIQGWLDQIAATAKTEDGQKLTTKTLQHFKSFLSGVFKRAIQLGYYSSVNPVRSTDTPKGRASDETYAYDLDETQRIISLLPQPASTVAALAGYAGLSRSEIRGLLWENYDGYSIRITQGVWQSHIGTPKTAARQDDVAVIPALRKKLDLWRLKCGEPKTGLMFQSSAKTPLDLNNLLYRTIQPILNSCAVCHKAKGECEGPKHDYKRDESLPTWRGWHAFRRGLATRLHDANVSDLTIQRILRHSDVSVTRKSYIKRLPSQVTAAMSLIEAALADTTQEQAEAARPN